MNDKAFCPVCKQSDLSHPAHTFRCAEIIELWKERDALRKQLDVAKEALEIAKDVMRLAINPNAYEPQYLIDSTYKAFRKIEQLTPNPSLNIQSL